MFGVGSYFRNIYLFGFCLQGHTEYNQGGACYNYFYLQILYRDLRES